MHTHPTRDKEIWILIGFCCKSPFSGNTFKI
jgi:hypothetical protein